MYADLTRMMTPAHVLSTMAEQGRTALELQKKAYDWQIAQVKAARKQSQELFEMGLENSVKAFEAMQDAQQKALDKLAAEPAEA
ncbi:MAG: hypothetical protein H6742_07805 [Alphaproteobacteria bacterium]|nr:hypothetical protein [Alphaproteobacteria bacterium]